MSVVVKNEMTTVLDVPGTGLVFQPDQEITVSYITAPLADAIQKGYVSVVSQSDSDSVTVEDDRQTEFDLPFAWPGPDACHVMVGGLVQTYGTDYEVDAEANTMTWLDEEIELEEGDVITFIRRAE